MYYVVQINMVKGCVNCKFNHAAFLPYLWLACLDREREKGERRGVGTAES